MQRVLTIYGMSLFSLLAFACDPSVLVPSDLDGAGATSSGGASSSGGRTSGGASSGGASQSGGASSTGGVSSGGTSMGGDAGSTGLAGGGGESGVSCDDGLENGDETGIDCGGVCGACVGESCESAEDCASGLCPLDVCVAAVGGEDPRPSGTLGVVGRYQQGEEYVNLPQTIRAAASVLFGSKTLLLGGEVGGDTSDAIYEATAGSDGLLESFALNETYSLSVARRGASAVIVGGYLYVVGGQGEMGLLDSVERAPLGPNGIAGDFEELDESLVTARQHFQLLVTPGHLYVIGGNYPQLDTIEVATLDESGDLTSDFVALTREAVDEDTANNGLVEARWTHGAIRLGNNYYVLGGEGIDTIERTVIQPDGTLGAFELLAGTLPEPRNRLNVVALAGSAYVFGGWNGTFLTTVAVAPIVNNELGAFSNSGLLSLEHGVEDATVLLTNRAVYLFGGYNLTDGATDFIQRGLIQQ